MRHLLILLFMFGLVGVSVRVAISAIRSCRTWRRAGLVGDTPTCTRCQYEIAGIQAAKPCPECGADLTEVDSVTIGRRHTKPWKLVLGVATLVGCGYFWWYATSVVPNLAWRAKLRLEPSTSVVESFRQSSTFPQRRDWEIRAELARRIEDGRMGDQAWRRLSSALFERARAGGVSDDLTRVIGHAFEKSVRSSGREAVLFEAVLTDLQSGPNEIPFEIANQMGEMLNASSVSSESQRRLASALIQFQAKLPTDPDSSRNRMSYPVSRGLNRAIGRGLVPLPQVQEYFEGLVRPQIVMEPPENLETDRTVRFQMRFGLARGVTRTRVACSIRILGEAAGWPVSGSDIEPAVMRHEVLSEWNDEKAGNLPKWWMTLPSKPGVYTLEAELDLRVYELEQAGKLPTLATAFADPARLGDRDSMKVHVVKRCSVEVHVIQAGSSVPITKTEADDPEDVWRVRGRGAWKGILAWKSTAADLVDIRMFWTLEPPPVTIAADVFVRQGDTVEKVGWILVPAGDEWHERVSAACTGIKSGGCTVILQPNPGILRDSAGFGPIYGRSMSVEVNAWSPLPSEWENSYYDWSD